MSQSACDSFSRRLGVLGGMSWESTQSYYRLLNEGVRARRGGLHSAPLLLWSVDFAEIATLQHAGDWDGTAQRLGQAAAAMARAGAGALLLATNTMHKVAAEIEQTGGIPLLHIADATGAALRGAGHHRVGLLGTRFTMEDGFYAERLQHWGIETLVPESAERERIHAVIYHELCLGQIEEASRQAYRASIERLAARGATAMVLGCTEIALLLRPQDSTLPLFDTTELHCAMGVDWLCGSAPVTGQAPPDR